MQNNIFLIMLLVSRYVEPALLKSIYRAVVFRKLSTVNCFKPINKVVFFYLIGFFQVIIERIASDFIRILWNNFARM